MSQNCFCLVTLRPQQNIQEMRVLIQSTTTFLFLSDRDTVTQNPDEARDFKHTSKALRYIRQQRLPHVQIVLKFPKSSDDVNLAILELLQKDQIKIAQKSQSLGSPPSGGPFESANL